MSDFWVPQPPMFNGYVYDYLRRAFWRPALFGRSLEYIPFSSPRGKQLLQALYQAMQRSDNLTEMIGKEWTRA